MRPFFIFVACLLLVPLAAVSQEKEYVREVISTLASENYHGRGYYKKGDLKAAKFIRKEFRKKGLQPLGDSYFQEFSMPINIVRGRTFLWIDDVMLKPGEDYLIAAFSPSTDGIYEPYYLLNDSLAGENPLPDELLSGTADKVIITDHFHKNLKRKNYFGAPAIILKEDREKLWWHVSNARTVEGYFVAEVKEGALPDSVINTVRVKFGTRFLEDYKTQNVAAYVKGEVQPDTFVVFTAHYDHLGQMGRDACFPGANDNASGTAMIMDLARHYANSPGRPYYSMAFIAFAGEEAGLLGSKYAAENPLIPLSKIKFLVNLDMVGTGSEGITVVNGSRFDVAFDLLTKINKENSYLRQVKIRGESCNSDHCPFYEKGVPSVFIYTMGKEYSEYHTVYDRPENLPLTEYEDLFRLLTGFVRALSSLDIN